MIIIEYIQLYICCCNYSKNLSWFNKTIVEKNMSEIRVPMMDQKKLLHWGLKEVWPQQQAWKERVGATFGTLASIPIALGAKVGVGDGAKITWWG